MGCGQGMVEVCAVKRISCTFVVKIPSPFYHLTCGNVLRKEVGGKVDTLCNPIAVSVCVL